MKIQAYELEEELDQIEVSTNINIDQNELKMFIKETKRKEFLTNLFNKLIEDGISTDHAEYMAGEYYISKM